MAIEERRTKDQSEEMEARFQALMEHAIECEESLAGEFLDSSHWSREEAIKRIEKGIEEKMAERRSRVGFTLVELLVVLAIISIVSAAVIPVILPALAHRQVSESARLVQAAIEGSRDNAIRHNAPRGVRLLADPSFPAPLLVFNKLMPIEPAPDYSEGRVSIVAGSNPTAAQVPMPYATTAIAYPNATLRIEEARFSPDGLPNARTSWYWNVRVGDRLRIGETGAWYVVIGPMVVQPGAGNSEQFVNIGPPGTASPIARPRGDVEFLYLVNGKDDNDGGLADQGWDGSGYDGVDSDGDGQVDELTDGPPHDFNGNGSIDSPYERLNPREWESETWHGTHGPGTVVNATYTIRRRPVPTQGARVVEMPSDVVIDGSTIATTSERSRLPVDLNARTVEIMISPNGTVIPSASRPGAPIPGGAPFLHLWLSERSDVLEPVVIAGVPYQLPMPQGTPNYPAAADTSPRYIEGDRRIVTINIKTGNVITSTVEGFDGADVNAPYYDAQAGVRGAD
jgi:prepilin-type N-terminal cleavage/methylation domain-containing protein